MDAEIQQWINRMLDKLRDKTTVFDLSAFLIKPIQRVLKYPLLLNELIKVGIYSFHMHNSPLTNYTLKHLRTYFNICLPFEFIPKDSIFGYSLRGDHFLC